MRKLMLGITLGFLVAAVLATNADALVMCAKLKKSTGGVREGTAIKLRTACKDNEEQLDPASLGLGGGGGPVLQDADGLIVGRMHPEEPSSPTVLIEREGRYFRVTASNAGLELWGKSTQLYFQDATCSTAPYVFVSNQLPRILDYTAAALVDSTGDVVVYYPAVARAALSTSSRRRLSDDVCEPLTTQDRFVAEALGPLTFRPPFTTVAP